VESTKAIEMNYGLYIDVSERKCSKQET